MPTWADAIICAASTHILGMCLSQCIFAAVIGFLSNTNMFILSPPRLLQHCKVHTHSTKYALSVPYQFRAYQVYLSQPPSAHLFLNDKRLCQGLAHASTCLSRDMIIPVSVSLALSMSPLSIRTLLLRSLVQ